MRLLHPREKKNGVDLQLGAGMAMILMRDDEERAREYHRTRMCACDLYLMSPPPSPPPTEVEDASKAETPVA